MGAEDALVTHLRSYHSVTGGGGPSRAGGRTSVPLQSAPRPRQRTEIDVTLQAKVNPEGYVAQRLTNNGEQRWILTYLDEDSGLAVRFVGDSEVVV